MRLLALLLLLLAPLGLSPVSAQDFPKLSGRVVDAANILPPDVEAAIAARSAATEQQTGTQLVVATVPSLQGYEIADYGYRLGRAWGIGQKDKDNGVILLVAPNERKVWILVGYGLEPVLTDALSSVIYRQQIIPRFREGDMPGGVLAGVEAIAKQLELPPDRAAANVSQADAQAASARSDPGEISFGTIVFLLFLFLWIWAAMRRSRGGRRSRSGGPIVIWGPGGGAGGWGGGGGGWGGGGGGGFSGGGGSFGGGGAGGSW